MGVSTNDDFAHGLAALMSHIDEATEDMRIAYPMDLFDRNMTDGRMVMVSCLTLVIGHNHGMGDIKQAKIHGPLARMQTRRLSRWTGLLLAKISRLQGASGIR